MVALMHTFNMHFQARFILTIFAPRKQLISSSSCNWSNPLFCKTCKLPNPFYERYATICGVDLFHLKKFVYIIAMQCKQHFNLTIFFNKKSRNFTKSEKIRQSFFFLHSSNAVQIALQFDGFLLTEKKSRNSMKSEKNCQTSLTFQFDEFFD